MTTVEADDRRADASDEDLVAEILCGSHAAFSTIFQRHHAAVRGLARQMVRDSALADDVTQDVFVRFLSHAEAFDPSRGRVDALPSLGEKLSA